MSAPTIRVVAGRRPRGRQGEAGWTVRCLSSSRSLWNVISFTKGEEVRLGRAEAWEGADDREHVILGRLLKDVPGVAFAEDGGMFVPDKALRDPDLLMAHELPRLGLPRPCPWRLQVSSRGPVLDPSSTVQMAWLDAGHTQVPGVTISGTLVQSGDDQWILRDPLLKVVEAVAAVNAATTTEARLPAQKRLLDALGETTGEAVPAEALVNMVIYQATALGIRNEYAEGVGHTFVPELLGEFANDHGTGTEFREILSRGEEEAFRARLDGLHGEGKEEARTGYVLRSRTFVALDRGVAAALGKVREVNRADPETRRAFFHDRMSFLIPVLERAGATGAIIQYAERVIGVQPWKGKPLKGTSEDGLAWWEDLPEAIVHVLTDAKGKDHLIPAEDIPAVKEAVAEAVEKGQDSVPYNGTPIALDDRTVQDVNAIIGKTGPTAALPKPTIQKAVIQYLATKSNLDEVTFIQDKASRPAGTGAWGIEAGIVLSKPKPHQDEGILWFQRNYALGSRGVLMADDMGLGKTFQVLAFLAWTREVRRKAGLPNLPVLIVAPTSLLGNWQEEARIHLAEGALGKALVAYGKDLAALKQLTPGGPRNDLGGGTATLDVAALQKADLVLTTYETFRDYHISFGRVTFDVVVFDEAQKVKESSSLVSQAARAMHAVGMRIVMTGTPVENGLMDLWTLMDIAWPGRIPYSGKDFRERFVKGDEHYDELKSLLLSEEEGGLPRAMLRRLKTDKGIASGLPEKSFVRHERTMPAAQAKAYDGVLEAIRSGNIGPLRALQGLRTVSLHPNLDQKISDPDSHEAFIAASARFSALFEILDKVRASGEKALVFVDVRRAQIVLQQVIRHRYGLKAEPDVINGETVAGNRTKIVKAFQASKGFNVLLLGPKAAGFGLTLTAANHVIHLNRWWNPAVEDQCTDRAHRIGAVLPVYVHLPIALHPELGICYDLTLDALLAKKRAMADVLKPAQFTAEEISGLTTGVLNLKDNGPIDKMDWSNFELWVAGKCKDAGASADLTPLSGDGGADVVLKIGKATMFVQCKHRSDGAAGIVDLKEALEVANAPGNYGKPGARLALVTNGSVSPDAEKALMKRKIVLVDCSSIANVGQILVRQLKAA